MTKGFDQKKYTQEWDKKNMKLAGARYKAEFVDEFNVKVYHDARGILVSKVIFDEHFKKPSKLRLFLHKHFIWF